MKLKSAILIVVLATIACKTQGANFGKFCNETNFCNEGAWLSCAESSTCSCRNESIFDPTKLKCVSKVGKICQVPVSDPAENIVGIGVISPECGSNATCGVNRTCECDPGFVGNSDGVCTRTKTFGEACAKDEDCHEGAFLSCVNGFCGCDSQTSVYMALKDRLVSGEEEVEVDGLGGWDPTGMGRRSYRRKGELAYGYSNDGIVGKFLRGDYETGKGFVLVKYINRTLTEPLGQCVGLAGQKCNPDSNCAANSTCVSGHCICDDGFSLKADGRCGAQYSKTCSVQQPCADGFACFGRTCGCPQGPSVRYDPDLQKCKSLLRMTCSENSDCSESLACTFNPKSGKKHCACAEGHLESYGKTCRRILTAGDSCAQDPFSNRSSNCDGGMVCGDGVCAWPDVGNVFVGKLRRCVGQVGSECTMKPSYPHTNPPTRHDMQVCVDGGFCEQPNLEYPGQCVCQEGYNYTMEGFCNRAQEVN